MSDLLLRRQKMKLLVLLVWRTQRRTSTSTKGKSRCSVSWARLRGQLRLNCILAGTDTYAPLHTVPAPALLMQITSSQQRLPRVSLWATLPVSGIRIISHSKLFLSSLWLFKRATATSGQSNFAFQRESSLEYFAFLQSPLNLKEPQNETIYLYMEI